MKFKSNSFIGHRIKLRGDMFVFGGGDIQVFSFGSLVYKLSIQDYLAITMFAKIFEEGLMS